MNRAIDCLIRIFIDERTRRSLKAEGVVPAGAAGAWLVFRRRWDGLTLYNPFGLLAGTVFVATLTQPWWLAWLHLNYYTIRAYAFVLRHDLPSDALPYLIETPAAAVAALVLLLAGYFFLVLWGSTMAGTKGRRFLLWAGIFMLMYCGGFYGSLVFATHRVGLPVTGNTYVAATMQIDIVMYFSRWYFTAVAAGAACALSGLLHGLVPIPLGRRGIRDGVA